MRVLIAVCSIVLGLVGVLHAQPVTGVKTDKQPEPEVKTVEFAVQPAQEPTPALKYQLLPKMPEEKPGNAALLYFKAFPQESDGRFEKVEPKIMEWLEQRPEAMPKDEVRSTLDNFKAMLDEVTVAARREDCDWELPFRDGNPVAIRLPETQGARRAARLLALKARLQIAERDFDGAIETIKTGFALAEDIAQGQTLINDLVGVAIDTIMVHQLETMSRANGSPSLYWALTTLPNPVVEMKDALRFEYNLVELSFPELRELDAQRTEQEWEQLFTNVQGRMREMIAPAEKGQLFSELATLGQTAAATLRAKQYLAEHGYSEEEVEKMSMPQTLLLHSVLSYQELRDDYYKWAYVAPWETPKGFSDRILFDKAEANHAAIGFHHLLPAIRAAGVAPLRLQRRVAALRIVEAIRLHANSNGGKLPATLDEITIVPVPEDPLLGEPFEYTVSGDGATLSAGVPEHFQRADNTLRYRIRIEQDAK